jgi:ribosome biogenesis GTPase
LHLSPDAHTAGIHAGELIHYGWTKATAQRYEPFHADDRMPGRLIRIDRNGFQAILPEGIVTCHPPHGGLDPGSGPEPAAAGDWAAIRMEPGYGPVLSALLPRRTAIERHDPSGLGHQVVAANVDKVAIVHGLDRPINPACLERFLVIAWESGAEPMVVLSKTDLVTAKQTAATSAVVTGAAPGVEVVTVSSETGQGVDALRSQLRPGASIALIGESGTGKSTLINRLVGSVRMKTGPTREVDGEGRHTTTTREVIPLSDGTVLIDTPGLRSVGLWQGAQGVALTFSDVEALAATCRFRDCRHAAEPGCAVVEAVNDGTLARGRVASYRKLQKELDHVALRNDVRARRAQSRADGRRYRRARKNIPEW